MKPRVCELCNAEAALYCDSDSALLCWNCDYKVHEANFLVARHVRRTICSRCNDFSEVCISGPGNSPLRPVCRTCLPRSGMQNRNEDVSISNSSSSSSSACISSTESLASAPKKRPEQEVTSAPPGTQSGTRAMRSVTAAAVVVTTKRFDAKAEGILVNWCKKLGLDDDSCSCCSSTIVRVASQTLGFCVTELRKTSAFRVWLAASFWFSLRVSGLSTWQILKRLQEVSGVPAKVILAAQAKVGRLIREKKLARSNQIQEEGCDECSD